MGPRLFSRGYASKRLWKRSRIPGFNGATTFQPWIRGELFVVGVWRQEFQWGHDFSAVDTWASARGWMKSEKFQWGHDFSAVDTRESRPAPPVPQCFNGATTFQPWIHELRLLERRRRSGFNGATTFQPWIPGLLRSSCPRHWRRFNGATTFQPWILEELLHPGSVVVVSMGPRLFSRGYMQYELIERITALAGFNGATTFQPWIPV